MGDRFFYILYFQEVGPAERELEADLRVTLSTILWGGSGEGFAPREALPAEGTGFLTGASAPPALPWPWLSEDDLDHYVDAFARSGFFGPISYYRNLDANYDRVSPFSPSRLTMPSCHIVGERDLVLAMAGDVVPRMVAELPGFRGQTLLPGVGHWTQQEAPAASTPRCCPSSPTSDRRSASHVRESDTRQSSATRTSNKVADGACGG
jgi:pimeloyl-ACP methyl ester carboxylesterase